MQRETLLISLCRLKALSGLGMFWADPSARLWRQQGSWCLPEAIRKQLYPDCKVFHWIWSQTCIILWFLFVTDEVGWSRAIQMEGILFWAFLRIIHLLLLLLNPKWLHIAALHLCTSLDHNNHRFEKELRVFNDCLMTVRAMAWWSPDSGGVGKAVPPQGHADSSNFPALSGGHTISLESIYSSWYRNCRRTKEYGISPPIFPLQQNPDCFCWSLPWPYRSSLLAEPYQIPVTLSSLFRPFCRSLPSPTATICCVTSRRKS